MGDRTKTTAAPSTSTPLIGVLRPDGLTRLVEIDRTPLRGDIAYWVENRWSLAWDLPEGRWFASQLLAHPSCSLTAEWGSHRRPEIPTGHTVVVTGVATRRFDVEVRGWGRIAGLRFRPGGLAALSGRPASPWTDNVVGADTIWPAAVIGELADPDLAARPGDWTATATAHLLAHAIGPDPRYEEVVAIIEDLRDDRDLVTVASTADRHGVTVRTLQRLFLHYLGVGPKWVLARYRMHDVVTDLDGGYDGPLTDLAHRYGWYDQAHFNRDFAALIGTSPGRYRDRADTGPGDTAGATGSGS